MIEITKLASSVGPLTKRISLAEDGRLISDGSACVMAQGNAKRIRLATLDAFAENIARLQSNEAIALGALRPDLPDEVKIVTKAKLSMMHDTTTPPNLISRTAEHIAYRPDNPALALIDIDTKGMPVAVAERIKAIGGYWAAIVSVLPGLANAGRIVRTSTSSCISRTDTGATIKGSNGVHVFVLVRDGSDIERLLRTLHDRCWLGGLGWFTIGAGGQLLERSIIDRTVHAAERLVFEAPPILEQPLWQDLARRAPKVEQGEAVDTRIICIDLSVVELARLRDVRSVERSRMAEQADLARQIFITAQTARTVERTGCTAAIARKAVGRQTSGMLLPIIVLPFDAEGMAGATVGDVLSNPDRFVGSTLADPLEGIEYGRSKAKVMRRQDGSIWVHSFAHGRTIYELRHDAASVETALKAASPAEIADVFIKLALVADLAPEDEYRLRELVREKAGIKARPFDAKIKAVRKEQAQQRAETENERRAAARTDKRVQIPVPFSDDERLPVMRMLDEILGCTDQAIPPMRDLDGHPVEVRCRSPLMLHELTSQGANQDEPQKTRLPAPILPLLTKHDRYSLAHEIEQHVEFTIVTELGGVRSVALPETFIEHFLAYRDSKLPRVGAIVTAPLVMTDGTLLAPKGLDRGRKLVFLIEPRLMELMPQPDHCTRQDSADALDYLACEWLCDVATNFAGKCVLIAMALTILERVLLPERPAFFVTAGKRGGGKTTAIMMIVLAVTGKKPAAAAWSPNEEERRKAILAYLAEGMSAMVWDNIPLGTTIACPTLEKVLTAESYSDRILGQSVTITVPSFTVMTFTGNNVGPKGDMASRSLIARLEVARPDPENRPFKHVDPVAWTLENRGAIIRALYTILLSNQQLKADRRKEAKTRFKTWWHLVGSAIENAADALVDCQVSAAQDYRYANKIDFVQLFSVVEEDDEEGAEISQILDILYGVWPAGMLFQAADVARLINDPNQGEHEQAAVLRAFFEPNGRRPTSTADISPRVISRRLGVVTGAPVFVGDRTMRLDRKGDPTSQRRAQWFQVCVMGG